MLKLNLSAPTRSDSLGRHKRPDAVSIERVEPTEGRTPSGSTVPSPRCVSSPTPTTTGVRAGMANSQVTLIVGAFDAT